MTLSPFRIDVADDVLLDLRDRLRRTRWPDQPDGIGWTQGTDLSYLRDLCRTWADEFDWRAVEAEVNALPQVSTTIDGQLIHSLDVRSAAPDARPLLLLHGWPSSPLEFLKVIGPLTSPSRGAAFHVVAPSLPGFAWSGPTTDAGWGPERMARAFLELMSRLGHDRFGVLGTDLGSVIGTAMARLAPERLTGLYLTLLPSSIRPQDGVLTPDEQAMVSANERRRAAESGYVALQATRPQTLAYALTDSPVGQAAWVIEKLRAWTDCGGDLESVLSRDEVLTAVTVPWVTATAGSSARAYLELGRAAAAATAPPGPVVVPTGVGVFPGELYPTTRRIAADHFALEHWSEMPRGGHFAAAEQPDLLVDDLRTFFRHRS